LALKYTKGLRAILIILISIAGLLGEINAQNFRFERLNEQSGLPQINIKAIHQGPQGYIWIGTEFSLLRYDGHTFESIKSGDEKPVEASIISLHNNINLVGAISNDKLFLFKSKSLVSSIIDFPNNTIVKPKKLILCNNEALIAAENGLWRYSFSKRIFENIHSGSPVTDIFAINTGKILFSKVDGIHAYYPFNEAIVDINYQPNSYIKHIIHEPSGLITWIEADNTFHHGNLDLNQIRNHQSRAISQTLGSTCFTYYKGFYLLGLAEGILSLDAVGNEHVILQEEGNLESLTNNRINCLFVDKTNNLWVGTQLGGINLHNPNRHKFELISYIINSNFSKCKEILSIAETKNGQVLFQNALEGIALFDPTERKILRWIKTGVIGNCIVPENNQDYFLVGTPEGLYRFKLEENQFDFISTKNMVKNFEGDIKSILSIGNNQYWMAGKDGMFLYDLKKGETLKYFGIGNSNLGSENIRSLRAFSPKEIYVTTVAGLYILNTESGQFKLVNLSADKKQPMVSSVAQDYLGNIWIGPAGWGVYLLNKSGEIEHLDKEKGISNNQIYSILMNKNKNQCWISTNQGLGAIDVKTKKSTNYYYHDGLQGSEFIESSCLLSSNGHMFFGGVAGLNYFIPEKLKNDTNECNIVIKSISTFNNKLADASYYNIPLSENYISIDYTSLDYYLNGKYNYFIKMEGLQNDWTDLGDRRFASFGQMPEGEYVFKVKAINPDGKESKKIPSLAFRIVPPFYQMLWFKIFTVILIAGLGAYGIYNRTRKAIFEEQELSNQSKMIAQLELKALRAQMNPHFIFNSLNSIQDFVLNNEGQQAARYLSKFAKLMRMILDISEQTFVNINTKISFLKLYIELEALRLNNTLNVQFEIDPEIDLEALIPTLLIQPHIENAIWHGLQYKSDNKILKIGFKKLSENFIEVTVEDNGIGRNAAIAIRNNKTQLHQSMASKNSEDRIHTLNILFGSSPKIEIVDLYDKNNIACGTKVVIQIPMIHG
jgi:ligand-binding sensor domain-containing protein